MTSIEIKGCIANMFSDKGVSTCLLETDISVSSTTAKFRNYYVSTQFSNTVDCEVKGI